MFVYILFLSMWSSHCQVIVIKICGSIAVFTILLKFTDCISVSLCSPNMTQ